MDAIIIDEAEMEWQDDTLFKLPPGVKSKVLYEDKAAKKLDALIRWPEGYVEPRHTHASSHSGVVIKGRVETPTKTLGPGGFIYGPPGVPHGPFRWLDGCVVFVHFEGDPTHHY